MSDTKTTPAAAIKKKIRGAAAAVKAAVAGSKSPPDSKSQGVVYCDANATTFMPKSVLNTMMQWANRGNPSSDYASAKESQALMQSFREYVAAQCKFDLTGPDAYTIIFTSGASESNAFIITSTTRAYGKRTGKKPHVVISAIEHKSVSALCHQLEDEGLLELTVLPVAPSGARMGTVEPEVLRAALRPSTCLVSIMAANNETGITPHLRELGAVLRAANGGKKTKPRVPFHTDAVQLFGKAPLNPAESLVDAFSVSFHKLHGPAGCGLLVVRSALVEGFGLQPLVAGSQNGGLRGGTEAIHNIAASFAAMRHTLENRGPKNDHLRRMRAIAMQAIATKVPALYLDDYRAKRGADAKAAPGTTAGSPSTTAGTTVVWIAPKPDSGGRVLPNTIFVSVARRGFCNRAARAALEARGVICSVGSACNTAAHAASGVVQSMDVPAELQDGVLRISFPDAIGVDDIKVLVRSFLAVIGSDECLASK